MSLVVWVAVNGRDASCVHNAGITAVIVARSGHLVWGYISTLTAEAGMHPVNPVSAKTVSTIGSLKVSSLRRSPCSLPLGSLLTWANVVRKHPGWSCSAIMRLSSRLFRPQTVPQPNMGLLKAKYPGAVLVPRAPAGSFKQRTSLQSTPIVRVRRRSCCRLRWILPM